MPTDHVILCDTKGVIYPGRTDGMNQWKSAHAAQTDARTLEEAMSGADAFFGLSVKGAVTPAMVNADGDEADHLRHGQSGSGSHAGGSPCRALRRHRGHRAQRLRQPGEQRPGLPYIFRGALDVRASHHQ